MLSIVIPVYNEAESLTELHREIREVAAANGYELDVVFVDDGSRDGSWNVIRRPGRRRLPRSAASASGGTSARPPR